ncbi:MAG: cytochrome b [Chloroflexota bacterium]
MRYRLRRLGGTVYHWLDSRLGVGSLAERLLRDPVPELGGWWYTFGAALFLLTVIQVATGIFLMFYYVPSWEGARESVLYIQNEVFLGWLVRGLHYWNMVMLVLLVGVHMLRTFVSAAYKVPRELVWVLGVLLLVLMVATAFTGGILRWDQSGYFDAVVGTTIAGWTPLVGQWVAGLWLGGSVINPLTLTRTFTLHVWLLPTALLGLSLLHIALVVVYGQYGSWVNYAAEPPDAKPHSPDEVASRQKLKREIIDPHSRKVNLPVRTTWFFPYHVFKEAVVTLGLFGLVLAATLLWPAPVDAPVDPVSTLFTPSSMWFWLFLDQMLLLFPGQYLIPIGVVVAPTVVGVLLLLLPWLDRTPAVAPWERPTAVASIFVVVAAIFILGLLAASRVYNYEFIVGGH